VGERRKEVEEEMEEEMEEEVKVVLDDLR